MLATTGGLRSIPPETVKNDQTGRETYLPPARNGSPMDEKTSDLRDLFVETTGSGTVTERQAESRGTLTDRDDAVIDERVRELVAAMRERYDFSTDLDDATYARIARGRFEKDDDEAVATALDEKREADGDDERSEAGLARKPHPSSTRDRPRRAVRPPPRPREADREVDDDAFDYADLKRLTAEGRSIVECADALDADPDAVAKYARVARVDLTSTRANDRFRDEFRDLLTDADIEGSHAETARNDGLEEATKDMETDTNL